MIQGACLSCGCAHEECTCTSPVRDWRTAKRVHRAAAVEKAAEEASRKYPELAKLIEETQKNTDEINRRRGRTYY